MLHLLYSKKIWFQMLVIISILFISILWYKRFFPLSPYSEGFTQSVPFSAKYDQDVYDSFYTEIYDTIHPPYTRQNYEIKEIIQETQATPDDSVFLDIGSGTGYLVNTLTDLGYTVCGIDKSLSMVEHSKTKYPGIIVKQGDVADPMIFDKNVFTHVLCLYFTIYLIQDKTTFFRHCYSWMKPGGYLIVHLVNPTKFSKAVPSERHVVLGTPSKFSNENIGSSVIDFKDFKYKYSYQGDQFKINSGIKKTKEEGVDTREDKFIETFTDASTKCVRQNEQNFYMDSTESILSIASNNGFFVRRKIDLYPVTQDSHQFLYIFERSI